MNVANLSLLETIGQTPDAAERYVIAGSIGRALALGQNLAELTSINPRRFQDIDLIDTAGQFDHHYVLDSGSEVDFGLSRTIRPVTDGSKEWGLYDFITGREPDKPLATMPESSLGIIWSSGQSRDYDIKVRAFDPCVQLALVNMSDQFAGRLGKHGNQLRALENLTRTIQTCDHGAAQAAIDEYGAIMHKRLTELSPRYDRVRHFIYTYASPVARLLAESPAGTIIRRQRGTQRDHQTIDQSSLLSAEPTKPLVG